MIVYTIRQIYPMPSARVAVCMTHEAVDKNYGKNEWQLCAPKTWIKASEYMDADGRHAIIYLVEEQEVLA